MKNILVLWTLMLSFNVFGQKIINMELADGVYKVPCKINGVRMKFIFDTGASVVSLSRGMAEFLLENGYMENGDIEGHGTSRVANGSVVSHTIVNIKDLEIDGLHIYNVKASVIESQSAPLLLGQTAIQRLGRISIDGNKLIIHAANESKMTEEQIQKLLEDTRKYFNNGLYANAIKGYLKLTENGFNCSYGLAMSYYHTGQYTEAISMFKDFIEDPYVENTEFIAFVYSTCSNCYSALKDYRNALLYMEKADYLSPDNDSHKSGLADCYSDLRDYYTAEKYINKAIELRLKKIGKRISDIPSSNIYDSLLGLYLYQLAMNLLNQNRMNDALKYVRLSAQCHYKRAIEDCVTYGFDY